LSYRDEELDAIILSACTAILHLKHLNDLNILENQAVVDNLRIASSTSAIAKRSRKYVPASNYRKPYACAQLRATLIEVKTFSQRMLRRLV
ncbi:hypothetical protein S83_060544, partial [Arachis hypogaea]